MGTSASISWLRNCCSGCADAIRGRGRLVHDGVQGPSTASSRREQWLPRAGPLIHPRRRRAANNEPRTGRRPSAPPARRPVSPMPRRIEVIAIAAQQHGLVVTGSNGEVLRPAKLWNDTESAPDAAELIRSLPGGAAGWAARCGSVPVPSFTITKLRWLRRCEPDLFRHVATVLLPHDWLSFRLTGRRTTDRGDASGTGYWSPARGALLPRASGSGGRHRRLGTRCP